MNAVNYGAPQLRERALFIGNRYGAVVDFPNPTHGTPIDTTKQNQTEQFDQPNGEEKKIAPWGTLGDAIGDLEFGPDDVVMDFSPRKKSFLEHVYLIKGSLDDPESYRSQLSVFKPDVLIHLAWDGVESQSRNATGQWRNVSYMLELMEIGISQEVNTFIGLGSQAEYG